MIVSGTSKISDINWVQLLVDLGEHKPAAIMDCMLFSLFTKIARLTPRLFGSLLGSAHCSSRMHRIVLSRIKNGHGQVVASVCEFLCALVHYQPGYFQSLTALRSTTATVVEPSVVVDEASSVLACLFDLLDTISKHKDAQDYHVSLAGILSVFYNIWSQHNKDDYMNYCRKRGSFWLALASSLHITMRNRNNADNDDDDALRYLEYFGFDSRIYENEMLRFDELVLESNIKCVAYSFKILALEIFDYVYLK